MNNLYVRLAAQNIKKHRRSYVPFMLAGVFVAAVSYILNSLSNNTELGPTSNDVHARQHRRYAVCRYIFVLHEQLFDEAA